MYLDWSMKEMTGLPQPVFEELFNEVKVKVHHERKHSISVYWSLIMQLFSLRHSPSTNIMASLFGTSPASVTRILKSMMPIVYEWYGLLISIAYSY